MKSKFFSKMAVAANKAIFKTRQHSPEICMIVGVVGTVGSAIWACMATRKLDDVMEESHKKLDSVHEDIKAIEDGEETEYTMKDCKKDLTTIYMQTGWELTKLYGPSILLGALSIGSMITSNRILRQRNAALATAYMTVNKSFKEYRNRVVERFGKDVDQELRYNIQHNTMETVVQNEDGTQTVVTEEYDVVDPNTLSAYTRIFDCGNTGWNDDPEQTLWFLRQQQNWANEKLKAQRYLYLNDVFSMLGFQGTKIGHEVGWIYDEKNPIGDNFVDFGIFDVNNAAKRRFVNGYEKAILLDFNVDGPITNYVCA